MFFKKGYINVNLKIKYTISFTPQYVFVLDGKCYNIKTARFVKQVSNNGSLGYIINAKFYSLKFLRTKLVKQ
jgi:hypothetical protein